MYLVSTPIPFECNCLNIASQIFLRGSKAGSKKNLDAICVGASATQTPQ